MKGRLDSRRRLIGILLLSVGGPSNGDEASIADPTELATVTARTGTEIAIVGAELEVESDISKAGFALVRIRQPGGAIQYGTRMGLLGEEAEDALFLDASETGQLRDELTSFDMEYQAGTSCAALSRCVHGVARCRPSQLQRQAFCPSVYSTPDGQRGIAIRTPRATFEFPNVEPAVMVNAVEAVIGSLELQLRQAEAIRMLRDEADRLP